MQRPTAGRWFKRSLVARIALTSAFFGFVLTGGAIVIGFYALIHQLDSRAALELTGKDDLLKHVLSEIPSVALVGLNEHRFGDLLIGHDDLHLALWLPESGDAVTSSSDIASQSMSALSNEPMLAGVVRNWMATGGKQMSSIGGSGRLASGEALNYYLSMDRKLDETLLSGFIKNTLIAWPLLLIVVALGSWAIAAASLAPLRRFHRLAAVIGTGSLSRRISLSRLPDELFELAQEFNKMLERINRGYRRLQEFSGELAHELRTPIATLMGRSQVALSRTRTTAELQEVLEGNVEELDRLSRLISDMLFIARADQDARPVLSDRVELDLEAQRIADYLSFVAEERGIRFELAGQAAIRGDSLMVQRAITNLLTNAIRHAVSGSTINIEILRQSDEIELSVINRGEAIKNSDLARVFDRFYRVDSARARVDGGSGLGLAIVTSIMQAHDGRATATCEVHDEVKFALLFPASRLCV